MGERQLLAWLMLALTLAACTSDPYAPINQSFPIRQMDSFFSRRSDPRLDPSPPDYRREPGYAPAYPPYRYRDSY